MKTIAVLIDFTDGAALALHQALNLAKKFGSKVFAINIADSHTLVDKAQADMNDFIEREVPGKHSIEVVIGSGPFMKAIPSALYKIEPDLVLVCTHGIRGISQLLFGADIQKLVESIPFNTLVLQENNQVDLCEVNKILLPVGPHPKFLNKVVQTAQLAKLFQAEIVIYEIDSPEIENDEMLVKNRLLTKTHFEEQQVNYSIAFDEFRILSAGYSRQTLEYAKEHGFSMISLITHVSKNDVIFGVGDKENFLVNSYGIPILCCSERLV